MTSAPFARSTAAAAVPPPSVGYQSAVRPTSTHPGTFASGTKVQVGSHRVIVDRYLSEGGFAHVYVVRIPRTGGTSEAAVLKRVAVPDKDTLANMRTEVETMKKLKGHRHIVTYIDSHASQLKGGGYEVFLLMEYCAGGGLIDFMNTRLQQRLTEPEILHIISDIADGVACMHYLKPPLLHRDLKVENVLISTSGSSRIYKLCDFGSTAQPRPAATTAAEGRLIEDDVQRHTTMQYRSPEMIDVYRRQPIDEKSDIWALGVLLYKLCYYTTPFEDQGQMAILNASFKFPTYPSFSERIKKLISSMLRENPQSRPNIYQVVKEIGSMRGTAVKIKDIYSTRSPSETRGYAKLPPARPDASLALAVGLQKVAPAGAQQALLPEVMPMRRGRPKAVPAAQAQQPKASGADPFAALDSKDFDVRSAAVDDLSAKFPSLDEFSILHDKGASFQFTSTGAVPAPSTDLNKRVIEVLADEAFAKPTATHTGPAAGRGLSPANVHRLDRGTQLTTRSHPTLVEPLPSRPILTSASPKPSPPLVAMDGTKRHDWRAPHESPRPRSSGPPELGSQSRPNSARLGNPDSNRTPTQTGFKMPTSSVSSRPSLEGQRPALDGPEPTDRSKSANSRPRPPSSSLNSGIDSILDRDASKPKGPPSALRSEPSSSRLAVADSSDDDAPDDHIASDVAFLRSIESDDSNKNRSRRRSSSGGKSKRSSIPTISLSGTKQILAGKFGDAFRRFETNTAAPEAQLAEQESRRRLTAPLSPIMGSEATGTSGCSDEDAVAETEALSPEVRRELERRRLSQEEKRVAAAGAEYRRKLETGDRAKGASKAAMIQNRVKTLLEETKSASISRTAEGYGKYTDTQPPASKPLIQRKPVADRVKLDAPSLAEGKRTIRTDLRPSVAPKPLAFRSNNASPVQGKDEDWEASFSKRYPSLSGIEMVETEITKESGLRVRDV